MKAEALIQRLQAQRESWCELEPAADGLPAKRVRLRRPAETEISSLRPVPGKSHEQVLIDAICRYAVGWEGITEADLLGADQAGGDAVPFAPDLWAEVVRDRMDWVDKASAHLMRQVADHLQLKEAAAKNS